jgi:hypothetical protein
MHPRSNALGVVVSALVTLGLTAALSPGRPPDSTVPRTQVRAIRSDDTVNRPAATPKTVALPAKVSSLWLNTFEFPTVRQLPADVIKTNNVFVYGVAQSAGAGTGRISWGPYRQSPAQAKQDIAGLKRQKKVVLLGVGGSGDGGITLTNRTQVSQMLASITHSVRTYGFTGIDFDLEPSGGAWNKTSLKSLAHALKVRYGHNFVIGLTVAMYGPYTEKWLAAARLLGSDYDYWAPMLYDFPEAHDGRLTNVAIDKVRTAVAGGVPARKQILGFMCNAYYNTSPVQVAMKAWKATKARYPSLRGAFIWEAKLERQSKYSWTRAVGRQIRR